MPILTHQQITEVAKGIVNMMVADVLFDYSVIQKAVDKIKPALWVETLDEFEERVTEILLNRFGVSD